MNFKHNFLYLIVLACEIFKVMEGLKWDNGECHFVPRYVSFLGPPLNKPGSNYIPFI